MIKKYNLLSLDPMYSPLHERIGKLCAKEKYAVTSCLSKKVYLPRYKMTLATTLIKECSRTIAPSLIERIRSLPTYQSAFAKKIEARQLSNSEVNNMARFYLALRDFIEDHKIELVLLHNDTRWYHAIAIDICIELDIPYLVTEQGLIRPHTTVVDSRGVNAFADITFCDSQDYVKLPDSDYQPSGKHDSALSMLFFFVFLMCFTVERYSGTKTILPYMHNNYRLRRYAVRLINRLVRPNKVCAKIPVKPYMLLLMQLESDSQLLVHSPFCSNQSLISRLEKQAKKLGVRLAIKKHPLDFNSYDLGKNSQLINGSVCSLSDQAELVVTVNSSASVDVLRTKTPLFLLGESIYDHVGVAQKTTINEVYNTYKEIKANKSVSTWRRKQFIHYLKKSYLTKGAGFSFCDKVLDAKLNELAESSREHIKTTQEDRIAHANKTPSTLKSTL